MDVEDIQDLVQQIMDVNHNCLNKTFCINVSLKGIEESESVRQSVGQSIS